MKPIPRREIPTTWPRHSRRPSSSTGSPDRPRIEPGYDDAMKDAESSPSRLMTNRTRFIDEALDRAIADGADPGVILLVRRAQRRGQPTCRRPLQRTCQRQAIGPIMRGVAIVTRRRIAGGFLLQDPTNATRRGTAMLVPCAIPAR